ncbi:class I SAM-dependent methyltransferase [Vibrio alfacsensis]|uniref:class I SAM-dependent methyltransferase n=1 Tax=Vibrio alfacsensis TaxID=1074311 RepID=UPI0040694432
MSASWNEYYKKIAAQPHRPQVEQALKHHSLSDKIAIDAGCGIGRDSHFLLSQGFDVLAFDPDQNAIEACLKRFESIKKYTFKQVSFAEFDYPSCTLFIASASLFFCPQEHFTQVWKKIDASLQPGSVFCGDFLGIKDSWVDSEQHPNLTALSRQQVETLFENYDVATFHERDEDGTTAVGSSKHWHVFSVTAIKR